jgi:hypothetical protein
LPRVEGQPEYLRLIEERILNDHRPRPTEAAAQKLARALRAAADRAMRAVTECQPSAIGLAHAHAREILGIIRLVIQSGLVPDEEAHATSPWTLHTLADFGAALERTLALGRAPQFVSRRDEEFAELSAKLDTLAWMVAALAAKAGVTIEEVAHA